MDRMTLTLKSSCDACTESKVKCSGGDPCARCVKKGIQCFYSPRKKRGPLKKPKTGDAGVSTANKKPTASVESQVQSGIIVTGDKLSSIGAYERRTWSVFFTLYKHYAVSCSLFWFNRQLDKMRTFLIRRGEKDALKRLSAWMRALNIDEDDLANRVKSCSLKIKEMGREAEAERKSMVQQLNKGNPFFLRVTGEQQNTAEASNSDAFSLIETFEGSGSGNGIFGSDKLQSGMFMKFEVDYDHPDKELVVETSPAFDDFFGYSGVDIARDLGECGGGFLPWGGDALSRILVKESDLLAFVQILAIKFNSLGKPLKYPVIREVPSCHMFDVNWRFAKEQGAMPCVVKCVHKEHIEDGQSTLNVLMEFVPTGSLHGKRPRFDEETVTIRDNVTLPPKRVRNSSVEQTERPLPGSDQQQAHIYSYAGAQNDFELNTIQGEDLTRDLVLKKEVPYDGTQQNLVDAGYSEEQQPYAVPGDSALSDDGFFESLPFQDNEIAVDQDDVDVEEVEANDWLDDLLTWTGPMHDTPALPPVPVNP
uniref:Zn(2)-C6 fungal-type domain-containing protein n=2 Tax=Sar TaxID=2698737 RepID=A0A7S2WSH6_9STRA|mmetsp:Transcript_9261/g.15041  ORF Transcript_9261/g.15041 Transcript_9261/m.15041 type:complete len:535 (-) Transcript_9261:616-2220(-)